MMHRFTLLVCACLLGSLPCIGQSYEVSGTVVNALNGSALSNCQIVLDPDPTENGQRGKPLTFITAEGGHFVFHDIIPGKYTLVARHNGYRIQTWNDHDGFSTGVAVGPGKDSQNIVFRMNPSASIRGKIEDEFGDPVSDANVSLFRRAALFGKTLVYPRGNTIVSKEGEYRFHDLLPGDYYIVVVAKPWYSRYRPFPSFSDQGQVNPSTRSSDEADLDVAFPVTYYPGVSDEASATPVKVRAGERATADIHIAAQAAYHFTTPKPDTPDKPVERHVETTVFGTAVNINRLTTIYSNDRVQDFSGIPAGHYRLRERNTSEDAGFAETRQQLDISTGGDVQTHEAASGTPVTGKVELEGIGGALHSTVIQLDRYESGEVYRVKIKPNGEFPSLQLFPGRYQYSMQNDQGVIKAFHAAGAKVIGRTVEVGTEPVSITLTVADVATEVTGVVQSQDGKPLSGAMVVIIPEDAEHNENIFRRDESDSDGTFKLNVVMPGKYVLVAIEDGWNLEWSNIDAMRRFLPKGKPIEILPSGGGSVTITSQSSRD